jgi:hypothetical protein
MVRTPKTQAHHIVRFFFILPLVVTTLQSPRGTANLQASQNLTQSENAAEREATGGRTLRAANAKSDETFNLDDEEQASIAEPVKTGTKYFAKQRETQGVCQIALRRQRRQNWSTRFLRAQQPFV